MAESKFTWTNAYPRIADAIYRLASTPERLGKILSSVFNGTHGVTFPKNAGEPFESSQADPFSFFASFNRGTTDSKRRTIIQLIASELGLDNLEIPSDFNGVPLVNAQQSWFFGAKGDRKETDIPGLWRAFVAAIDYADNPTPSTRSAFIEAYDAAINQFLVSWKLTMGLFWIRPYAFMTLDSKSRAYLQDQDLASFGKGLPTGEQYLELLDRIRETSKKSFPELSAVAYEWASKSKQDWWPSLDEYDPAITVKQWLELLSNKTVFDDQSLTLMHRMVDHGGEATCKQLSDKYGQSPQFYISTAVALAKRVAKATGCPVVEPVENSKWWPVLFIGKPASKADGGTYIWKLRPELREALETFSPNAPSHWWLTANPKIWSLSDIGIGEEQEYTLYNEKGNPRRILSNFLAARKGDMIIGYEAAPTKRVVALCEVVRDCDGKLLSFKKVRDVDAPIPYASIKADPVLSNCEFCKNPNGSFFKLTEEEFATLEAMMDETSPLSSPSSIPHYGKEKFLESVYVDEEDYTALESLLRRKKNLILQGAPGTGKTFAAKRLAYSLMGAKDKTRIEMIQFHQNSTYEDIVIGYRPTDEGGFEIHEGVFMRFCKRAAADPEKDYFFIIDEINRANISKVFGELLMLIESDHRGDLITLPVGGMRFSVPDNLYIIGMMNTADRGLALIDYALRRRFAFFEMKPALDHARFRESIEKAGAGRKALEQLVDQVAKLNKTIADDPALGKGFCIGHSYFCVEGAISEDDVHSIARYEIEPLIEEYWFDEPDKVKTEIGKLESIFA